MLTKCGRFDGSVNLYLAKRGVSVVYILLVDDDSSGLTPLCYGVNGVGLKSVIFGLER